VGGERLFQGCEITSELKFWVSSHFSTIRLEDSFVVSSRFLRTLKIVKPIDVAKRIKKSIFRVRKFLEFYFIIILPPPLLSQFVIQKRKERPHQFLSKTCCHVHDWIKIQKPTAPLLLINFIYIENCLYRLRNLYLRLRYFN
jgi:hypothetical protein